MSPNPLLHPMMPVSLRSHLLESAFHRGRGKQRPDHPFFLPPLFLLEAAFFFEVAVFFFDLAFFFAGVDEDNAGDFDP